MTFHLEISLFFVLGENGDARNQNNLDVKSSPPGTPESKSSSSTGEGGQATGCGQTGSSSGGGGVCGGNKMMAIRVQMLDDSITLFQVQVRKRIIRRIRMYYHFIINLNIIHLMHVIIYFSVESIGKNTFRTSVQATESLRSRLFWT